MVMIADVHKSHGMSDVIVNDNLIHGKILHIRGRKVLLDRDLALLYGVETKVLNQAVKRNIERFPEDFMFQLTKEEMRVWREYLEHRINAGSMGEIWKSQLVTSRYITMGIRKRPFAFTEQGVAMLSSVLKSGRAIQVNIQIMRTFTRLREMIAGHRELREKLESMEKKYDKRFKVVFGVIKRLLAEDEQPEKQIGFDLEGRI